MALDGPHLIYTRREDTAEDRADSISRALRLAREVEELLEETSSVLPGHVIDSNGAHSTRIVRAMAASLVDELEAMVSGKRNRSGTA